MSILCIGFLSAFASQVQDEILTGGRRDYKQGQPLPPSVTNRVHNRSGEKRTIGREIGESEPSFSLTPNPLFSSCLAPPTRRITFILRLYSYRLWPNVLAFLTNATSERFLKCRGCTRVNQDHTGITDIGSLPYFQKAKYFPRLTQSTAITYSILYFKRSKYCNEHSQLTRTNHRSPLRKKTTHAYGPY